MVHIPRRARVIDGRAVAAKYACATDSNSKAETCGACSAKDPARRCLCKDCHCGTAGLGGPDGLGSSGGGGGGGGGAAGSAILARTQAGDAQLQLTGFLPGVRVFFPDTIS